MPVSGSFVGLGVDPRVASAVALASNSVRVTFTELMEANAALTNVANYVLTPDVGSSARTVTAVTVEGTAPSPYVVLTLDGTLTPGSDNYQLLVTNVEDAAGNPLDLAFDTVDFSGPPTLQQQAENNVGIARPLTQVASAIGEELTDLGGFRGTRLTALLNPEERIESGVNNLDSTDGGYTGTLNSGNFVTTLVGHQLRLSTVDAPVVASGANLNTGNNQTVWLSAGSFPLHISGVGNSLSALSGSDQTLTDTGNTFSDDLIGRYIRIRDAANAQNEGYFPITDAPTTTTLVYTNALGIAETSSFTWSINGVIAGDFLRFVGGEYDGVEIEIQSVDSSERITLIVDAPEVTDANWEIVRRRAIVRDVTAGTVELESPGLGDSFADLSWESFQLADTTAEVESTYNWYDSGRVVIDNVDYRYASRTQTTLDGLERWDGETWRAGAAQEHAVLSDVIDISRRTSAIDSYWRRVMVDYATGSDLDAIGRTLSVRRPAALTDDDIYRNLIKAIAYGTRGIMATLEEAMDAILGPGNYELFTDLTGHVGATSRLNHTCSVYIRVTGDEEVSVGKTFIDGVEVMPLTASTTLDLGADPVSVTGALLAPEPGLLGERVIEEGTVLVNINFAGEGSITSAANPFSTRIQSGDTFTITSGQFKGDKATILSRIGADELLVASVNGDTLQGSPTYYLSFADAVVAQYRITRPFSNFRYYRPSDEVYVVDDAGGTQTQWAYNDPPNEATETSLTGNVLTINAVASSAYYDHALRVLPESRATFHFYIGFSGTLLTGANDFDQISFEIHDGERILAAGLRGSGATAIVSLYDTGTGAALAGAPATGSMGVIATGTTYTNFTIVKNGRNDVNLLQDGRVVHTVAYSSFPAVGAATDRRLRFGCPSAATGLNALVRAVDWGVEDSRDLWNVHLPNCETTAPDIITDLDGGNFFSAADIGRTIRLSGSDERRMDGEWLITSVPSANSVRVTGVTHTGGTFVTHARRRFSAADQPRAFRWPDLEGESIEILAPSVNAGVHVIDALLDAESFVEINTKYEDTVAGNTYAPGSVEHTNTLQVTTASAEFAGFDESASWRRVPNFPNSGACVGELVGAGTVAGNTLTFRQDLADHGLATNERVLVRRSRLLTGQVLEPEAENVFENPDYTYYPFYLYDALGSAGEIMKMLTVAGVIPVFDKLVRDDAGLHVLE